VKRSSAVIILIAVALLLTGFAWYQSTHRAGLAFTRQEVLAIDTIANELSRTFAEMDSHTTADDRKNFVEAGLDGMDMYHDGFGMGLRNDLGLWSGETTIGKAFRSFGMTHADYMSTVIMNEYWRHLADKPSELARELAEARAAEIENRRFFEGPTKNPPPPNPNDPFARAEKKE
jgi:hypothetical protein